MKPMSFLSLLVIIAYHMASACPPPEELIKTINICVEKMMLFVEASDEELQSKCPMVKEGMDCVDEMLEECKDNEALYGQYDILKDRIAENRNDFAMYCASSVMPSSNIFLTGLVCFATFWLRTFQL